MNKFYYVYVLYSKKDGNFYVGYTYDIRKRFKEHQLGQVSSTRQRIPLKLIYWECCINQNDALQRERYLKTAWGKRYLKNRLKNYLTG
jgi:putative endonuclease